MKNITLAFVFLSTFVNAQSTFPFDIVLEAVNVSGAPGLQSYSKAEHNGDWLILGGRTDGLHQRQVYFIHMNHTNPMLNPNSNATKWVLNQGFNIARKGQSFDL